MAGIKDNWGLLRRIALLILALLLPLASAQGQPDAIKIGVLTKGNPKLTHQRWPATADYLNRTIPEHHFEIVLLDFPELEPAVKNRQIDFLLANPAIYVELEERYGLNALLTLQRRLVTGASSTVFAGAILVRADRDDIQRITDLRGRHFAAVDKDSFGGWAMAWRQMQLNGLTPLDDLASIDFTGSHEDVVRAVMSGAVDAGTVRSGILEEMVARGELHEGDLRVLPEEAPGGHPPYEFGELHSTTAYPEWPLARLAHVSDELARQVSLALLAMPANDAAAVNAGISGWIPPLSYAPVHALMKDLRLAQYRNYGQVALLDAIRQHWRWAVAMAVVVAVLVLLVLHVLRLNLRNAQTNRSLQSELTEKMAAQHEALAQKERLTHILESIAEAYFAVDRDWCITTMNSQAQELLHRGRNTLIGRDLWAALPPLATIAYSSFNRSFELGEPFEFTAHYPDSDYWLEFHTYPAGVEMGIYFRDVTARIKAAAQLEESEQRLRAILENMLEGVITIDTRGVIQSFNKAAQTIFSYRADEVVGKKLDMLMPPANRGTHTDYIDTYLAGGAPKVIGIGRELYGRRKSGETFPLDITVSEITANGQSLFVGICRDISERKQAEARAMQLATAIDHAAEGVFITDVAGRINYVNPAYAAMVGMSSAMLLGQRAAIFELVDHHHEQHPDFYHALQQEQSAWSGHYPVLRTSGLHYIEEATIAPVRDPQNEVRCYVGVCRDVTHKLRHEQQQRHADRIEATATLATSIAHEFNHILTTIIEQTRTALAKIEPHTVVSNNITQVMGAASRARILVRQLLNFGQQEYEQPQLLNPRDVVKGAVALLQSVLPATVNVKQKLTEEVGALWIAPGQFQQVIMSLVLNAIRALDDSSGIIEVGLGQRSLSGDDEEVGAGLAAGGYAVLTIADSAPRPQMASDDEENGMELITVHDIIRRNGGALYIDKVSGKGTTFRIYLPLVAGVKTTAAFGAG